MSLAIPIHLSFSKTLSSHDSFFPFKFSHLSLTTPPKHRKITIIRMGGGPRTYPGGVSKWQWKRMQDKKAKQLLKARLARERQIYEMRKRAELKAAVSELERPWELVQRAPTLFSVKADEQVKVLADRFQKPGGFDMWSDRDGPQLFETPEGFPSARFFPKGVVHSIKPYGVIPEHSDFGDENLDSDLDSEIESENEIMNSVDREIGRVLNKRKGVVVNSKLRKNNDRDLLGMEVKLDSESEFGNSSSGLRDRDTETRSRNGGKFRKQGNRSGFRGDLGSLNSEQVGFGRKQKGDGADGDAKTNNRTGRRNGNGNDNRFRSDMGSLNSEQVGLGRKQRGDGDAKTNRTKTDYRTGRRSGNLRYTKSEVYDMDLQLDGSYGFQAKTRQLRSQKSGN